MQSAKRSLLSFLLSVAIHAIIIFLLFWSHLTKTDTTANSATGEISTSISMEMLMAMVEADTPPVVEKAPEPEKQEMVEDPTVKPEPPKVEKPKEPFLKLPSWLSFGAKKQKTESEQQQSTEEKPAPASTVTETTAPPTAETPKTAE